MSNNSTKRRNKIFLKPCEETHETSDHDLDITDDEDCIISNCIEEEKKGIIEDSHFHPETETNSSNEPSCSNIKENISEHEFVPDSDSYSDIDISNQNS